MEWEMRVAGLVGRIIKAVQGLAQPSYRPECHYMRGPGPACLRRAAAGR